MSETIWVLDHLDDLDADFIRFYKIMDMYELDGPRFFALAHRVSAYGGVMTNRIQAEQELAQKKKVGPKDPRAKTVELSSLSEFVES